MTQYRGAMVPPFVPVSDLQALLQHKANVIRYQLTDIAVEELSCESYKTWVRQHMDHIENLLPVLEAHNAKVVIDLHTPPGGIDRSTALPIARMFTNRPWGKECFTQVWEEIARQFVDAPEVLAYDALNEPACPTKAVYVEMTKLYKATIKRIRAVDPTTPVIVSPPYGDPEKVDQLVRYTNNYVWYTVHVYTSLPLTHQGIGDYPAGKVYPNEHTNRTRLLQVLAEMRAFQLKTNAKVFVGEFGFSIYGDSESRRKWFRDVTRLLEKYRWDWCLHAFHESPVWEVSNDPTVFKVITDLWNKNS